jgi:hypothetical protein
MADDSRTHALLLSAVTGKSSEGQKQSEHTKPSRLERLLRISTQAPSSDCVEVAFHHAGYDPDLYNNTVLFRLKGAGGVCYNSVLLIFYMLCVDQEPFKTVRFALTRNGPPLDSLEYDTIMHESN